MVSMGCIVDAHRYHSACGQGLQDEPEAKKECELMTVNDLIKQLQAMSEEDRERVVVMSGLGVYGGDDYYPLNDLSIGWYKSDHTGGEFEIVVVHEDGTGKERDMDGLYQRSICLRGGDE